MTHPLNDTLSLENLGSTEEVTRVRHDGVEASGKAGKRRELLALTSHQQCRDSNEIECPS